MRICAIIPSYNHVAAVAGIVARLRVAQLPVFVIDDGSGPDAAAALAALHEPPGVVVHRLDVNQGKGGAVMAGFALARGAGFSHAVQVDADGQHDLEALPTLLAAARAARGADYGAAAVRHLDAARTAHRPMDHPRLDLDRDAELRGP